MTTRTRTVPTRQAPLETAGPGADDAGPGSLLEQAAAYGNVAREALDDCTTGINAEDELQKRRNRSGQ